MIKKYLLLCLILISVMGQDVYANELDLEQSMEADSNMKDNRFDIEYSEKWTSKGETIKTYDISDTGKVAIAFSNSKIGVFDENMNFMFELSFKTSGAFGVLWKNENLLFLDDRSKTAVECNENGEFVNTYTITGSNNYWTDIVENRKRIYKNYEYYCTNESMDIELVHVQYYTILKRISKDGEEEVLYSSTRKLDGVLSGILLISTFLLLCALFLVIIIVTIVRKEKENQKFVF